MGWLYDLGAVEADMALFNEGGGESAVFDHAGEPQPFVETLGQR
jgi:hypothetical protein